MRLDRDVIEQRYRSLMDSMGISEELGAGFPHFLSGGVVQGIAVASEAVVAGRALRRTRFDCTNQLLQSIYAAAASGIGQHGSDKVRLSRGFAIG